MWPLPSRHPETQRRSRASVSSVPPALTVQLPDSQSCEMKASPTEATVVGAAGYLLGYSRETLERWVGRSGIFAFFTAGATAVIARARLRRERLT
jgi:hypothetical protein